MSRRHRPARIAGLALIVALSGCSDRNSERNRGEFANPSPPATGKTGDLRLAYRHDLSIGLSPEKVAAHFSAARERCLGEAALRCVLVRSSANGMAGGAQRPYALVEVRLPHESVAPFVAFVTSPLPGEKAAEVALDNQSTRAEDLTKPIGDSERRLAQLRDYRDRLNALSARPDSRVEDLIRAASELSQVQSQIEEREGERGALEERVQTEIVTVTFLSDGANAGAFAPIGEAWARGGRTLGDSAGAALRFTISSLPWLPIVMIAILIVRTVWRLRGRPRSNRPELEPRA